MPPRQKEATASVVEAPTFAPRAGDLVHVITRGGAKYKSSEVLEVLPFGMAIRTDVNGPTLSEISYIPWHAIDGVGFIGKR